ncbi:MAG: 30S ribosomal protein S17 [Candidatus Hodgkinia cicadicola]
MTLIGKVVKICSLNTVSVLVIKRVRHPKYIKLVTKSKKYLVHDLRSASMSANL